MLCRTQRYPFTSLPGRSLILQDFSMTCYPRNLEAELVPDAVPVPTQASPTVCYRSLFSQWKSPLILIFAAPVGVRRSPLDSGSAADRTSRGLLRPISR